MLSNAGQRGQSSSKTSLHALDLRADYRALWTEADNLGRYQERYPEGFATLLRRLGYRLRPSWIWQRERYGCPEWARAQPTNGDGSLTIRLERHDDADWRKGI